MSTSKPVIRTLDNGVRACLEPFEGAQSFALTLRMKGGASQEPAELLGLSNVMETALIKGTATRDAAKLFDAFDELGIERSGGSGLEALTLHASILPRHIAPGLKLYREVLETASFPEQEVGLAKTLALEDLASLEDQPRNKVVQLAYRRALGEKLGRRALGEKETIARIERDDVTRWLREVAFPANLTVTAAGGIDPDTFFDAVEAAFGDWAATGEVPAAYAPQVQAADAHEPKESEQAHIVIIYPGAARSTPEYYAAEVAMTVLSGGGSSRLFTEVREKRGLCYAVSAGQRQFRDGAIVTLYAGTTAARAKETLEVCLAELQRLATDISADEVARAKNMILGRLRTVGELAGARGAGLADDLFLTGTPRSQAEIIEKIAAVTLEQARAAAERYQPTPRTVAVLGPTDLTEEATS